MTRLLATLCALALALVACTSASTSAPDSGRRYVPRADAATAVGADAGTPAPDSGPVLPDSGAWVALDSGAVLPTTPPDAGSDAGPTDAGPPPYVLDPTLGGRCSEVYDRYVRRAAADQYWEALIARQALCACQLGIGPHDGPCDDADTTPWCGAPTFPLCGIPDYG